MGVGAQKFADLVAQKSDGKMKVSLFPGAVLGGDLQNLSSVRGGTLDFTTMATGLLAGLNKEFMIFDFPFLFKDFREAYALSDGPVGTRLLGKLADQGIIGLGIWDLGFRNITNSRRPITKPEDVQGLKLRVIASPIYIETFKALGANPVPMTFGEVYTALESKAIDGQDNPVVGDRVRKVRGSAEVHVAHASLLYRHAVADEQEDMGFHCLRRNAPSFVRRRTRRRRKSASSCRRKRRISRTPAQGHASE